MRLIKAKFEILPHLPYDQMLASVCRAITQCYKAPMPATFQDREKFIAARIKMGHDTVIEHVGFSVLFTVNRGITHELVRHRLCSFTQESTRYCNYSQERHSGEVKFILPGPIAKVIPEGSYTELQPIGGDNTNYILRGAKGEEIEIDMITALWASGLLVSEDHYLSILSAGGTPEFARDVLMTATAATIDVTANMREWRLILNLRALGKAGRPHPQMTEVMSPLLEEVRKRFPVFFADLQ